MSATVKRHSVRGALYGVLLGLGLMLTAVGQGMAALGTWPPFILLLAGPIIGILWARYAPAKGGPPPATAKPPAAEAAPDESVTVEEDSETPETSETSETA